MTFTYDLANADDTIVLVSKIRLQVGDTTEDDGVLPDGSNLSDEEIEVLLDQEDDDYLRATAAACELLARHWARVADIAVGPRREALSKVAESWRKQAKDMRARYGYGTGGVFSAGVIRVDGLSDDEASDDVESTGSEYEGDFYYVRPE